MKNFDEVLIPQHGGEVERLARRHGFAAADLLDFSANINPAPPPANVLERLKRDAQDIALLMRYPDLESDELRGATAAHCKVEKSNVVIANGSAALIDAAIRAVRAKKCLLPVPSFSEYARALRAFGCEIENFPLSERENFSLDGERFARELKNTKADFCIVNNPHNPSGAFVSRDDLEVLVKAAAATDTVVLLDEAFIDYQPEASLTPLVEKYTNLIVLRSLTKFYSMPALRVGYAVTNEFLARKMTAQIPSWSVTTLAANAAAEIFREPALAEQICGRNEIEKKWLRENLSRIGLKVYPSAANFLLIEFKNFNFTAAELFERLLVEHKIIVRDCSNYENLSDKFARVAVRARAGNERLVAAMRQCLNYFERNRASAESKRSRP